MNMSKEDHSAKDDQEQLLLQESPPKKLKISSGDEANAAEEAAKALQAALRMTACFVTLCYEIMPKEGFRMGIGLNFTEAVRQLYFAQGSKDKHHQAILDCEKEISMLNTFISDKLPTWMETAKASLAEGLADTTEQAIQTLFQEFDKASKILLQGNPLPGGEHVNCLVVDNLYMAVFQLESFSKEINQRNNDWRKKFQKVFDEKKKKFYLPILKPQQ